MKRWATYKFILISMIAVSMAAGVIVQTIFTQQTLPKEIVRVSREIDTPESSFVPELIGVEIPEWPETYLTHRDMRTCSPKSNRRWLTFYKDRNRYFLENRRITFGKWEFDAWGGYFPMRFINDTSSAFVIEDTGMIKPGPAETLFVEENSPFEKSSDPGPADDISMRFHNRVIQEGVDKPYKQLFDFEGSSYTLRTAQALEKDGRKVTALLLENGKVQQPITSVDFGNRVLGDIVWLGDIDHDRKIDILMRYYPINGDGITEVLYVSSLAKQGKLVTPYATYFPRASRECPQIRR